jgi:hypothetical protein
MDHDRPEYPEISRAQWAVLSAWTDQRCEHMMEAADFIADLSPEAKDFLKGADKEKVKKLNEQLAFYSASKTIWRFLWIGGGVIVGIIVGATQVWKAFGEYFTVKFK